MQCSGTIGPPNSILDVRAGRVIKGIFLHVKIERKITASTYPAKRKAHSGSGGHGEKATTL